MTEPLIWQRVAYTAWSVAPHPYSQRESLRVRHTLVDGTKTTEHWVIDENRIIPARVDFKVWWRRRSDVAAPRTAHEALACFRSGEVRPTAKILHIKTDMQRYIRDERFLFTPANLRPMIDFDTDGNPFDMWVDIHEDFDKD
jgi:hypothetical protein